MHPSQYGIIWRGKETRNTSSFKKLKLFCSLDIHGLKASKFQIPFYPFAIVNFCPIFAKRTHKRKMKYAFVQKGFVICLLP
jgi:hypothetical protein